MPGRGVCARNGRLSLQHLACTTFMLGASGTQLARSCVIRGPPLRCHCDLDCEALTYTHPFTTSSSLTYLASHPARRIRQPRLSSPTTLILT